MTTGKVDVPFEWDAVSKSDDPVAFIRQATLTEIEVRHGYDNPEITAVNKDGEGVLHDSCRRAYLWMRGKAERQRQAEYKAKKKGEASPVMPPLAWKVPISYERPTTRGFMEKEVVPSD